MLRGSGTTSVLSSAYKPRTCAQKEIVFAFVEDIDFFFFDHSLIVMIFV